MALPPKRELGTPDAPPAPPTGSEYSVEFVDLAQGIKNLRQAFLNRERFPMSHKQAADLAATSEALLGRLRQDMGNDKGYQRAKTDPANASDAERRRAMVMDRLVAQTQEVSNRAKTAVRVASEQDLSIETPQGEPVRDPDAPEYLREGRRLPSAAESYGEEDPVSDKEMMERHGKPAEAEEAAPPAVDTGTSEQERKVDTGASPQAEDTGGADTGATDTGAPPDLSAERERLVRGATDTGAPEEDTGDPDLLVSEGMGPEDTATMSAYQQAQAERRQAAENAIAKRDTGRDTGDTGEAGDTGEDQDTGRGLGTSGQDTGRELGTSKQDTGRDTGEDQDTGDTGEDRDTGRDTGRDAGRDTGDTGDTGEPVIEELETSDTGTPLEEAETPWQENEELGESAVEPDLPYEGIMLPEEEAEPEVPAALEAGRRETPEEDRSGYSPSHEGIMLPEEEAEPEVPPALARATKEESTAEMPTPKARKTAVERALRPQEIEPPANSRIITGDGGWKYAVLPNKDIKIIAAPKGHRPGMLLKAGSGGYWDAIATKFGVDTTPDVSAKGAAPVTPPSKAKPFEKVKDAANTLLERVHEADASRGIPKDIG